MPGSSTPPEGTIGALATPRTSSTDTTPSPPRAVCTEPVSANVVDAIMAVALVPAGSSPCSTVASAISEPTRRFATATAVRGTWKAAATSAATAAATSSCAAASAVPHASPDRRSVKVVRTLGAAAVVVAGAADSACKFVDVGRTENRGVVAGVATSVGVAGDARVVEGAAVDAVEVAPALAVAVVGAGISVAVVSGGSEVAVTGAS
mmetsp:Transcript_42564/g.131438  ORF Transcript_42564/g.131438 Transcript_42564/m.131438 type:complete len:207 (+) Transcript_42564:1139-1759(+)